MPRPGTSKRRLVRFYERRAERIVAGASLSLLAVALFVLVAAGVRRRLAEAEGDDLARHDRVRRRSDVLLPRGLAWATAGAGATLLTPLSRHTFGPSLLIFAALAAQLLRERPSD